MRSTIVIGAGLIGVTTAHALRRQGRQVTVLEARKDVGCGASYANGGILTPSMADPWNSPGVFRQLWASLLRSDAPLKLRPAALWSLSSWGLRFLRNSSPARHLSATRAAYELAAYSVRLTRALRVSLGLEYDAATIGTMKVFGDAAAMRASSRIAERLSGQGLRVITLDRDGAIAAEPLLSDVSDRIHGALRFPDDESGDALAFCHALAARLEADGVRVCRDVRVNRIRRTGARILGVECTAGSLTADEVVVAAGVHSRQMVRPLGFDLPIRPAKGYSITIDLSPLLTRPRMPLVDDALHAAIVPIGDRLRVAGTAEFAGFDYRIQPARISTLWRTLAAIYPRLASQVDQSTARAWTGLRPMSSDGLPTISSTSLEGLYVNTGHGHLGWTMATGSAELLADIMSGRAPAIDPAPYRLERHA